MGATSDAKVTLILECEPENPYDCDAIKVLYEHKPGRFFHLGYIPNADTLCGACGKHFERHPNTGSCPECGAKGRFERFGTATRLKGMFVGDAQVEEVTGGENGQSYGCNISIHAED